MDVLFSCCHDRNWTFCSVTNQTPWGRNTQNHCSKVCHTINEAGGRQWALRSLRDRSSKQSRTCLSICEDQPSEWGKEQYFVFIFRPPEDECVDRMSESLCTHHGSCANKRGNITQLYLLKYQKGCRLSMGFLILSSHVVHFFRIRMT